MRMIDICTILVGVRKTELIYFSAEKDKKKRLAVMRRIFREEFNIIADVFCRRIV